MKDLFLTQYNKVFDSDGNVKPCGRSACSRLIEIADKIETNVYHGNANNGMMNVPSILALRKNI